MPGNNLITNALIGKIVKNDRRTEESGRENLDVLAPCRDSAWTTRVGISASGPSLISLRAEI